MTGKTKIIRKPSPWADFDRGFGLGDRLPDFADDPALALFDRVIDRRDRVFHRTETNPGSGNEVEVPLTPWSNNSRRSWKPRVRR